MMLDLVKQLAKAMKDTNTSDITKPSKFSGADHHWDEWNYQLRSYLEAKGWLATYDHPTGPGTAGFDTEIYKKLYNKLTMLCTKGTAITYLRKVSSMVGVQEKNSAYAIMVFLNNEARLSEPPSKTSDTSTGLTSPNTLTFSKN
jgi:hypothetical protein